MSDWFDQNAPQQTSQADWFASNAPQSSSPNVSIGGQSVNLFTGQGADQAANAQARQLNTNTLRNMHGAFPNPESSQAEDESINAALGASNAPKNPLYLSGPKPIVAPGTENATQIAQGANAMAGALSSLAPVEALSSMVGKGAKAATNTEEWQKINNVIGATMRNVRIGQGAETLEDATTMPGRALANLGYTAKDLSQMTPMERMGAIVPEANKAGRAVTAAIQAADAQGTTLDAGKSAMSVLSKIKNPQLQQQVVDAFNSVAKEQGIQNLRQATPSEVRDFRDAFRYGARFGPGGDLNSLGGVRAQIYGAISNDLEKAVPGLDKINETYSDLRAASNAAQNSAMKAAVQPPPPGILDRTASVARKEALPWAIRAGVGGAGGYLGYQGLKTLHDLFSPQP